jgi:hypothetical protein
MVLPALEAGGYRCERQVPIGTRPGGRKHVVDLVATAPDGSRILVSVKWQQSGGTAEEKVPYEVICLAEAVRARPADFARAYLVLGGAGWRLRDFFVSGGLDPHLVHAGLVRIRGLEQFVADSNRGRL